MGKKAKRNRASRATNSGDQTHEDSQIAPKLRAPRDKEENSPEDLQFEDPYPDHEVEEDDGDEIVVEQEAWSDVEEGEEEGQDVDDDGFEEVVQSWNPFSGEDDEKLEMDPSAYKMHHALTPEWPSLSFDFLRDDLGEARARFPHSLIAAVGTQADRPADNQLTIMKLSDLTRIQVETDDDILGEEYDPSKLNDKDDDASDNDSDEGEDAVEVEPIMEHYSIKHYGGVNRIRAMPQQTNIVATWSDAGKVNLFNVEAITQRFAVSQGKTPATPLKDIPTKPFFSYSKHGTEGYALDWSPVSQGHLASGDCHGRIHLWSPRPDGTYAVTKSYDTSTLDGASPSYSSVEDLQWSPSEATVLASAECGGYVRIYDSRAPNRAMLSHKIHSNGSDVNVLSWNKLVHNLLATGSDDGVLSVWDLRHFATASSKDKTSNNAVQPLARFTPHKTPITSVEWHPTDESMLAVSDDRGAYIYDLSVEEDDVVADATSANQLPPQLLFVHCGSEQFKEVHWHPQISSLLMTTALSGYSVFIPSNL